MNVSDFAIKYKFKDSDKKIVEKLYPNEDKSESDWIEALRKTIHFNLQAETILDIEIIGESEVIENTEIVENKKNKNQSKK